MPPLPNMKKKKKGKKLKGLRKNSNKGRALIFNSNNRALGSPIRIGGDTGRRGSSIQNNVAIAPMNYLS
jgi:hypothetical protein